MNSTLKVTPIHEKVTDPATDVAVGTAPVLPTWALVQQAPWKLASRPFLDPWVNPESKALNTWELAEAAGLLRLDSEDGAWAMRHRQENPQIIPPFLRKKLAQYAERVISEVWMVWSAPYVTEVLCLPLVLSRLLPDEARWALGQAWPAFKEDLVYGLWMAMPEEVLTTRLLDPTKRGRIVVPPMALPVAPSPDLWLAWMSPQVGAMVPLLIRSGDCIRAGEAPLLRHQETGHLVVPTVVGTTICLAGEEMSMLVMLLDHMGGLWVDVTCENSVT
ncbi:MAG: hypothetical protein H6Q00_1433 [Holophagaceae bacterium]|nr:hypothetical protein [Holophagaceae bacterium]